MADSFIRTKQEETQFTQLLQAIRSGGGGGGGSTVEVEQILTQGNPIAKVTVDDNETTIYETDNTSIINTLTSGKYKILPIEAIPIDIASTNYYEFADGYEPNVPQTNNTGANFCIRFGCFVVLRLSVNVKQTVNSDVYPLFQIMNSKYWPINNTRVSVQGLPYHSGTYPIPYLSKNGILYLKDTAIPTGQQLHILGIWRIAESS